MSATQPRRPCPDCDATPSSQVLPTTTALSRRDFVRHAAVLTGAAAMTPWAGLYAAPTVDSPAETIVQRFFATLSPEQRGEICFPFDHANRTRISANWHVSKPTLVGPFYTAEQKQMIGEIFKNLTSEDGHARFIEQMNDDSGGLEQYSVAVFGTPGEGAFEWALTGRHMTIRADGDSVAGAAFGGPIVYGHGEEENPKQNLFYYQTQRANEVFRALDAKQAEQALIANSPAETAVQLRHDGAPFAGIGVGELSKDQKQLVRSVIKTILAPYRDEDVLEALQVLEAGGGLSKLHMAFYRQDGAGRSLDLNNDQEWDVWRIEGPTFVCHFRGAPHVHAYINIAKPTT